MLNRHMLLKKMTQLNGIKGANLSYWRRMGSGKTEVHSSPSRDPAMENCHCLGARDFLTPQNDHRRFISRFGDLVAIMHSGLSDGENAFEWRKVDLVRPACCGRSARSATASDNIGAIIIDEEHEVTYKQESNPHHAEMLPLLRLRVMELCLSLGQQHPLLRHGRAQKGVYHFLELDTKG